MKKPHVSCAAEADREKEVLVANAERDAQILRGDGDATAIETYASAFSKDKDFYAFYRSINAYQECFQQQNRCAIT